MNENTWQSLNINAGLLAILLFGFGASVGGTLGVQSWVDSRAERVADSKIKQVLSDRITTLEEKTEQIERQQNNINSRLSTIHKQNARLENLLKTLTKHLEKRDGQ